MRPALILALIVSGCATPSPEIDDPELAVIRGTGSGGETIRSLLQEAAMEGRRRGYAHFVFVDPATAATVLPGALGRDRVLVRFLSAEEARTGGPEIWSVAEILAAASTVR